MLIRMSLAAHFSVGIKLMYNDVLVSDVQGFNICIYYKMITSVILVNLSSHSYNFFPMINTLKIYSLSNF